MKNKKSYVYIGLPVLGMIFYLAYIRRSAIDMVYSDYIRLINSYLPDVWNPDKFFCCGSSHENSGKLFRTRSECDDLRLQRYR